MSVFDRFFLRHAILPVLRSLRDHSLVFLGEPNQGKTPTAVIVAWMFSRYYINHYAYDVDARVRTAPDLDFFRGDPGTIYQPCILYDGDLNVQDVKRLSAGSIGPEAELCVTQSATHGLGQSGLDDPREHLVGCVCAGI